MINKPQLSGVQVPAACLSVSFRTVASRMDRRAFLCYKVTS